MRSQIHLLQLSEDKDLRYQESRIILLACGSGPEFPERICLIGFTKRLTTGPIINGLCHSNNSRFPMKVNIRN
jgi:hypothetical protein